MKVRHVFALALALVALSSPYGARAVQVGVEGDAIPDYVLELVDQSGSSAALRCGMGAQHQFSGTSTVGFGTVATNSGSTHVDCAGARGGVTPSRVCAHARLQRKDPSTTQFYDVRSDIRCNDPYNGAATSAAQSGAETCGPCSGYTYRVVGDVFVKVPPGYTVARPNGRCVVTFYSTGSEVDCRMITTPVEFE